MSAAALEREAHQALRSGGAWPALRPRFVAAVNAYLEEGGPSADWLAARLLGDIALVDRAHGDLEAAVSAANGFMNLALRRARWARPPDIAPPDAFFLERTAWMNCALVFDETEKHELARSAWLRASLYGSPGEPIVAFCRSHAAGAELAQAGLTAMAQVKEALGLLGDAPPTPLLAGCLGAVGQSAGASGVPFLAQSAWLMCSSLSSVNPSNVRFLVDLSLRLGPQHALVPHLACLLMVATFADSTSPDPNQPPPGKEALHLELQRLVAWASRGRGVNPQAYVQTVKSCASRSPELRPALRRLVPDALWCLPGAAGPMRN